MTDVNKPQQSEPSSLSQDSENSADVVQLVLEYPNIPAPALELGNYVGAYFGG